MTAPAHVVEVLDVPALSPLPGLAVKAYRCSCGLGFVGDLDVLVCPEDET